MTIITPDLPLACGAEAAVSPRSLLAWLHRRGRLVGLLRHAAAEELCVRAARAAGLAASSDELQRAANDFRRRQGLLSAEQTRAWLAAEQLPLEDFEAGLEEGLLVEKFKDHLLVLHGPAHFQANAAAYARASLREMVVPSEGLARELLQQLNEDGADFAELARRHSLAPSRTQGGDLGTLCRIDLPAPAADAVFAAREGQVVGPLLASGGHHLYHVERLLPPDPDCPATRTLVRQAVFEAWLCDRLNGLKSDLTWLKELDGPG